MTLIAMSTEMSPISIVVLSTVQTAAALVEETSVEAVVAEALAAVADVPVAEDTLEEDDRVYEIA